jgi:hypothetical protein
MAQLCSCSTATLSSSSDRNHDQPAWHAGFLQLLPGIRHHACYCFRHLSADAREEAICEVLADSAIAYARLHSRGKANVASATVLAWHGVCHYREGRRVGSNSVRKDVLSEGCQRRNGRVVASLEQFDDRNGRWREILLEDRTAGPAETAAVRVDFSEWLETLSARDRRLAETLAMGERTGRVARVFRISAARVSQLRRELCESWQRFVDELADTSRPSVVTA